MNRVSRHDLIRYGPVVVIATLLAIAAIFVLSDRWRRGAILFGLATLACAVMRATVSEEDAGILAVRGKRFDVAALATAGSAILLLAFSISSLGTN